MQNFLCSQPAHLFPIRTMQEYLRFISKNIEEIDSVIPDGVFGKETQQAVLSFQQYFNLPETGEIDYSTWEMIFFVYHQLQSANETAPR